MQPGLEDPGPIGEATRREVGEIIRATKVREFKTLGHVLGVRYDSPLIVADGSAPPERHFSLYIPSACPGCLAPHLWLEDGRSLYDLFGQGFTLLATDATPFDAQALVARRGGARNAACDRAARRPAPARPLRGALRAHQA